VLLFYLSLVSGLPSGLFLCQGGNKAKNTSVGRRGAREAGRGGGPPQYRKEPSRDLQNQDKNLEYNRLKHQIA